MDVPLDPLELMLVDRIVQAQWRLNRCQAAEHLDHDRQASRIPAQGQRDIRRFERRHGTRQDLLDEPQPGDDRLLFELDLLERLAATDVTSTPGLTLHLSMRGNADRTLERLGGYEQRLERTMHRALLELRNLRGTPTKTWCDLPPSPYAGRMEVEWPGEGEVDVDMDEDEDVDVDVDVEEAESSADPASDADSHPPAVLRGTPGEGRGEGASGVARAESADSSPPSLRPRESTPSDCTAPLALTLSRNTGEYAGGEGTGGEASARSTSPSRGSTPSDSTAPAQNEATVENSAASVGAGGTSGDAPCTPRDADATPRNGGTRTTRDGTRTPRDAAPPADPPAPDR